MLGIEPPAREATDCQRTRSSTKLAGQLANLLFDVIRRDLDAMRVLGGRLFFCLLFLAPTNEKMASGMVATTSFGPSYATC